MKARKHRLLSQIFGGFAVASIMVTGLLLLETNAQAKTDPSSEPPGGTLILKLVDPNGKPVAGAKVGTECETFITPYGTTRLWGLAGRRIRPSDTPAGLSDEQGVVRLSTPKLFQSRFQRRAPVYVWQDERRLVALALLKPDDLGQPKAIAMEPACLVHGKVQSKQLSELGQPLHDVHTYLSWQGIDLLMTYVSVSFPSNRSYQFFLPSGEYELEHWGASVAGAETQRKSQKLLVQPDKQEMDVGTIDLPPTNLASLIGKPAPELRDIKAWKNGGPAKLSDFRGKVVVLDFWGYWCGPCVTSMLDLMKLQDKLASKGAVIIAVHDNSVGSIEEMDEKLRRDRKEVWQERDIPFLVALDAGEGRGATHEAYGIQKWPTTLIIDKDGKIVKHIKDYHSADPVLIVQRMLGQLPEMWKPWLTSECECCDVERYYKGQEANK